MRYAHVCTSAGCSMPQLLKAANAEVFAAKALLQLAKGRKQPKKTTVGSYVEGKAPKLARALHKVLESHGKRMASHAALLYSQMLQKDTGTAARIQSIIEHLNSDDLGRDLEGEIEGPMLAAFKRAAAVGATQVGFSISDITQQVDGAAVSYADKRGGELIKDLAGTTDNDMRALLSRAVEEGMSADELSDAVLDLGAFGESRADMIARTELAFAHVQGNLEGWKASDQVTGKQLVLGDLHEIPDECDEAADMGVVGIDDDFGGLGDPPLHPNCICDIEPVLSEEPADETEEEGA
jgi:hypothetical protein